MKLEKSEIQSAIATTIICIIIILILIFCGMTAHRDEKAEGVMISFGYEEEGFGESMPNPEPSLDAAPLPEQTPPPAAPQISTPTEENLITQEDPSVVLEEEKKREKAKEEKRLREEEQRREREKAEQERIEREKAAEEARKKAEQDAKKSQATSLTGSAFQNMGKGQGQTKGETQQGNPAGKGSQGGNSWSLNGRSLLSSLAQPSYQGNEEGRIVVEIRVDATGNVVSATITKGTTITNENLRNAAIEAARKNKFSTGNGVAIGTITYNFRLN